MALRIPVGLSPHWTEGKACGYYIIASRIFQKPVKLCRQQFVGLCGGCMVVTVGGIESYGWDSVLKMAVNLPVLGDRPVNWLSAVAQYRCHGGFRTYVPSRILKPPEGERTAIHTYGEFDMLAVGRTALYYVRLPAVTGDIMLGRKRLKSIDLGERTQVKME